ncbi:DUF6691 family protein [Parvularcula sp. LCG005]|uniref:DUF6691 family protein n=1 Tax=Parvularcula sp. LCG005 TaxID=3078805 RepID=UPI00294257C5|nr:DUF6691 family protein [Parvularcula sp. LCG005]WOI52178.1 DUF6691 family protein [Parvularcula sp. LCG005]
MRSLISSFLIGSLFGGGLIVSGMTDPAKVQNFLDVFGQWDPSLALVMGGALAVTFIGFRLVWRRPAPLDHDRFEIPRSNQLTKSLIIGSVLFGAGWGLAGLCPGPALAVIPMAPGPAMIFFVGLYGGVILHTVWEKKKAERPVRE